MFVKHFQVFYLCNLITVLFRTHLLCSGLLAVGKTGLQPCRQAGKAGQDLMAKRRWGVTRFLLGSGRREVSDLA